MATLYEYYQSQGQNLPSVQDRSSIYESSGLGSAGDYYGTAQQNTALLNSLTSGAAPAPTAPQPTAPTGQPTPQAPTQQSAVGQAGGQPTGSPSSAQDLINQGYGGYQGWDDAGAIADFKATGGSGKRTGGTGVTGLPEAPSIDLTTLYDDLYRSSGVGDLEAQLATKTEAYNQAMSKINDNPYLSEATRVGRGRKLTTDFENSTANLQNQIVTQTADVQNRLNLATQQYGIDSDARNNSMTQFNNLLAMGALGNASGSTIASLAGSTGLSSEMIQSAINASQRTEVDTQVIQSTDNQGNVTVSVIDKNTGQVISQESLGAVGGAKTTSSGSKPSSTDIKNENKQVISTTLSDNTNSYGHVSPAIWNAALRAYVEDGLGTAKNFELVYGYLRDPNREDEGEAEGYIIIK